MAIMSSADVMTITVENLEKVQRNIEDTVAKISDGSLVARAALTIERQAKINATGRPGPRVQTGRLRASITIDIIDNNAARVGTNVVYAPSVEFGHAQEVGRFVPIYGLRRIGGGEFKGRYEVSQGLGLRLVNPRAPAYPFLGPTIEQTKNEVGDVIVTFGDELGATWSK